LRKHGVTNYYKKFDGELVVEICSRVEVLKCKGCHG